MIHRGGIVSTGLVVLSVIIFFLAMGVSPAYGATFRVNELSDAADASPGDGVCETSGGVCTLRAAIQEANALAGRDVVKLKGGIYLLTIPGRLEDSGATGDLDILDDLVLKGKGSKKTFINGNRLDRVLHVIGAEVVIKDLTIQNGLAEDGLSDGAFTSGAGGGIANSGGAVTIVRCAVANNVAQGPDGGGGGGIANLEGSLLIKSSLVSNNSVLADGSDSAVAGGIFSDADASLVIRNSTIAENQAVAPGGYAFGGGLAALVVDMSGSTMVRNVAFAGDRSYGGGIGLTGSGSKVANSRISGNRAVSLASLALGGGVESGDASLTVEDSIICDNSAISLIGAAGGGGIHGGDLVVRRSTLTRNAASMGGGICYVSPGGTLTIEQGSRIIRNLAGIEGGGVFLSSGIVSISSDSVIRHNSPDDTSF